MSRAGSAGFSERAAAGDQIATEIERVVRRWQQLPLDHALSAYPMVRDLVQTLADEVAAATGLPPDGVPDVGPAVVMDQLRVMLFDYQVCGLELSTAAGRLIDLRRSLP